MLLFCHILISIFLNTCLNAVIRLTYILALSYHFYIRMRLHIQ